MLGMKEKPKEEEGGESGSEDWTVSKFESSIKSLRRFTSLGKFLQPTKTTEAQELLRVYRNTEKILGVMTDEDKRSIENLTDARKASLADSVGLTTKDVDGMVLQYTMAREGHARLAKMRREGTPMPKTPEEIKRFAAEWMPGSLGSPTAPAAASRPAGRAAPAAVRATRAAPVAPAAAKAPRNALCPCGSKKKYKRCCGKGDSA